MREKQALRSVLVVAGFCMLDMFSAIGTSTAAGALPA
jgi:hypothetical protein